MTETNEIKTPSINLLITGKEEGREVLLVGLKQAYRDKPQHQRALKREFDQCHEIEHPNILKYLDTKEVDGYGPSIMMEWEPARTLTDYMAENHSREEKKTIIRQLADAVMFLHQNGKVHGALNPSCVFVTTKGDQVKLLNFRLRYADLMSEPSDMRKYRAPEAKDGTVALDERTDVFSMGMILKEMDLGAEYQSVVVGSCGFARNDRFENIDAFVDAFEHRRTPRRPVAEGSRPAGNKRMAILIATIVGIVAVAAITYFNYESTDSTPAQQQSEVAAAPTENGDTVQTHPQRQQDAETPASGAYSGDLDFLNTLVPQMHIDIDKIYASSSDPAEIRTKVQRYYRGLRKALGNKTEAQFAAYDKEFADYINKKNGGQ